MTQQNEIILHPAVATTVARWHDMIAHKDLSGLMSLLHPDAIFCSPMAFKPYSGANAVHFLLRNAFSIFENFKYHRELGTADGLNLVLEFSAEVSGKSLKGIDLIRFDENGQIVEFEVMIRPMSGLQALGEQMAARIAAAKL